MGNEKQNADIITHVKASAPIDSWWDKEFYWEYKRKEVVMGIIILIISGFIIPYLVSSSVTQNQIAITQQNERKSLANGYLNDIEQINKSFITFSSVVEDPNYKDYGSATIWIQPFYSEWGLYYSNRQEISKFDPELSKELYDFYYLGLC